MYVICLVTIIHVPQIEIGLKDDTMQDISPITTNPFQLSTSKISFLVLLEDN
jgi:hypothetical protein